ncbi:hypothetical protein NC651_008808 [Populus alba x Populus x berolinensis]|nr:hypothetical protein NC651_008808 [Populus alba x Populus x berolinensis]
MIPWQLQEHGGMQKQWSWMLDSGAQKAIDRNYESRLVENVRWWVSCSLGQSTLSFVMLKISFLFLITNVKPNLVFYTIF